MSTAYGRAFQILKRQITIQLLRASTLHERKLVEEDRSYLTIIFEAVTYRTPVHEPYMKTKQVIQPNCIQYEAILFSPPRSRNGSNHLRLRLTYTTNTDLEPTKRRLQPVKHLTRKPFRILARHNISQPTRRCHRPAPQSRFSVPAATYTLIHTLCLALRHLDVSIRMADVCSRDENSWDAVDVTAVKVVEACAMGDGNGAKAGGESTVAMSGGMRIYGG